MKNLISFEAITQMQHMLVANIGFYGQGIR